MKSYQSLYGNLKFERRELFQFVRETYAIREVLYPGCSIHITPSLYFPHVVYVDQSEAAALFFAEEKSLHEFVNRNKNYKKSAYIRFIHQDYSTHLPLMDGSFGLLLALFAGGVSASCVPYLKAGGVLITNNHQGDAVDAARDDSLVLKAMIRFKKGKYRIEAPDPKGITAQKRTSTTLKQVSQGMTYVENETYYVFERARSLYDRQLLMSSRAAGKP